MHRRELFGLSRRRSPKAERFLVVTHSGLGERRVVGGDDSRVVLRFDRRYSGVRVGLDGLREKVRR